MPPPPTDILVEFPRCTRLRGLGVRPGRGALAGSGLFIVAIAAWLPLVAGSGPRDGAQVLVNATTEGTQGSPAVAALPGGKVVVVWAGQGPDDTNGIYARIRDPETGFGTEFLVNESTEGDQRDPAVAADAAGNFLVAWTGPSTDPPATGDAPLPDPAPDPGTPDPTAPGLQEEEEEEEEEEEPTPTLPEPPPPDTDIFTRRFDATGTSAQDEQRLDVDDDQGESAVAPYPDGSFAVAFSGAARESAIFDSSTPPFAEEDQGIFLVFAGSDTPTFPGRYLINRSATEGAQRNPSIAVSGQNIAIAWEGVGADDEDGVFASLSAAAFQSVFRLNNTTSGHQGDPVLATRGSQFVAAWAGEGPRDPDGIHFAPVAAPTPGTMGPPFETLVNSVTDDEQGHPAIAASAGGFVTVAWDGRGTSDTAGIHARRWNLTVNTAPISPPFLVGSASDKVEARPVLAATTTGQVTVAFEGSGTDTDVYVRRYTVNDPPVVVNDSFEMDEGEPSLTADVSTNDPDDTDGDTVTYTQVTGDANGPEHGTVSLQGNGTFTYTLTDPEYHGIDRFRYRASDGNAQSAQVAQVIITIKAVDDGPPNAFPDGPFELQEDTSFALTTAEGVLANDKDPDGDDLRAVLTTQAIGGDVTLDPTGTFVYRPHRDFCSDSPDYFTYRAKDVTHDEESASVRASVKVNCVRDEPRAVDDLGHRADEDSTLKVSAPGVLGNDFKEPEEELDAFLASCPANGTVDFKPDGSFTYTPNQNVSDKTDTFTYWIATRRDESQTDASQAPEGPIPGVSVPPLNQIDPLDLTQPRGTLTQTASSGEPQCQPSPAQGPIAYVKIVIAPGEDAPLAGNDTEYTPEDTLLDVPAPGVLANDADPDGGTLTVVPQIPPNWGTLTLETNGAYKYQPFRDRTGRDAFSYEVTDETGDTAIGHVELLIGPQGDVVLATDDRYQVREDASLTVGAPGLLTNDVDPDGQESAMILTITRRPSHGNVDAGRDGSFIYAPTENYNGVDGFTYSIKDQTGNTAEADVIILVTPSDEAGETTPTTVPGQFTAARPLEPSADATVVARPTTPSAPAGGLSAPVVPMTVPTTAPQAPPTVALLPVEEESSDDFPTVPVAAGAGGALGLAGLAGALRSRRRLSLGPLQNSPL